MAEKTHVYLHCHLRNLWSCIRLNDEYQEYYRQTNETLLTLPKGGTGLGSVLGEHLNRNR